ncbi:MAG TPA: radical SAM protein, partial [Candidatus Methylomirabilis sp.]|nr:radical SAM protein [Candidatus Methylomirabilis sp.]
RERGIPVIMGGPHAFFHAEEAIEHCDAVAIGEGEEIWPAMLQDAANNRLQKIYRAPKQHDLKGLPIPRYDLMKLHGNGVNRTYSVQSSRGCPFKCEFCSERFYIGDRYRYRPTQDLVDEIKEIKAKNIFFADSMFAGKKEHSMELMEALVPLNIRWSTLWTTYLCRDEKFMDLAKRSGLLHVNMGMESISQETLASMNKNFNKVHQYDEILDNLRKRGISYSLNFVFGWDGETPDVFQATLEFLEQHRVPVAYFYILNPHKGTPLYERMKQEGRILDEKHMRRTPAGVCEIKPLYCSPEELEENVQNLYDRFYNLPSMFRRLPLPVTKSHVASWILNFTQRRMRRSERTLKNFDWT